MSIETQKTKMRKLAAMSKEDLSYKYQDKKVWLNQSKAFLRSLAVGLGLEKGFKVFSNPGGDGVNGDSTLMGMWGDGNGIYVELCKESYGCGCVLYREITHMKDYSGGRNQWCRSNEFAMADYAEFVKKMMRLNKAAA